MKNILLIIIVLVTGLFISCSDTEKDEKDSIKKDKCEDVNCSGFGSCEILNEEATCKCNTGYKNGDNKLTCIKSDVNDPCADITCGDNGECQTLDNQATCNCITGYHAVGLNCVKNDVTDPCAEITCGDNGECKVVNDSPSCDCAEGFEDIQLICQEIIEDFDYKTIVAGTINTEKIVSVAVDDNDNRWVVGEYSTSLDLGCENTLSSINDSNAFVAKLSKSGRCLKLLQLESNEVVEPNKIFVDGQNVYIMGSFMGNLTIGGNELTSRGEADILLIKIDTDGNYIGSETFGSLGDDYGYGLFAQNGDVYISGTFQDELNFGNAISKTPAGGDDLFIAKLNDNMETQWVYTVGSSGDEVVNDLIVKDGFVYAVGEFSVSIDFDDTVAKDKKTPFGKDGFILKLTDEGVYQWVRTIGGDLDDYLSSIVIDDANNLFVAGSFTDIIDANWGEEAGEEDLLIADGHHDIFITKLDADGNYLSTKQFIGIGDTEGHKGDDFVKDMLFKNNKLYITGVFSDLLSFDPADEDNDLRMTEGGYDGFLVVLNNELYESAFTFGGDLDDYANSIAIDSDDMLIMVGSWQNTANFSPDTDSPDEKESKGKQDLFIWNKK